MSMRLQSDFRWICMGSKKDVYGLSMIFPWGSYNPIGFLFGFHEVSMGFLWHVYGILIGFLWEYQGISIGFLWDFHDMYRIFLWDSCGMSKRFPWGFFGVSTGFHKYLQEFTSMSMRLL